MSSRSSGSARRPVAVALCLMLIATAMAVAFAATAHAYSAYKMVLCAAGNGSANLSVATNTQSAGHPTGIFDLASNCAGPLPDPAGDNGYLRIAEHEPSGNAGYQAYASISWTVPPMVVILAGGGYTREPNSFNDGWRGRFWAEDFGGGTNNILMQGTNTPNSGIEWGPTSTFASHLWPFGGYGWYRRFVFEMTCFRQAGCDRSNYNAVDANTIVLTLADVQPSHVWLTNTGAPLLSGQWVRGNQTATYAWTEEGSGIRFERVWIDNAQRFAIDHQATGECNTGWSPANGEFARDFQPCATGTNIGRAYSFDTASLADGAHTLRACTQDYAEYVGLNGTGAENCDSRTIRVDNTPPGAPSGLEVTSANPARYLPSVGAHWQLPPNQGSPIAKVHYDVVDSTGKEVEPEKTVSATEPTALKEVQAPSEAGNYRLRVWLEDEVGFEGPPATVPIPRDTTPPAAPQDLAVTAPATPRSADGFDLRWRDVADNGSPIAAARYQVLDSSGKVVVPTQTVKGEAVQSLAGLEAPGAAGRYTVRLWLEDAEGNAGAPASAPLAYECARSAAEGGTSINAGLGEDNTAEQVVQQGQGSTLQGKVWGPGGAVSGATVCVFDRVLTDQPREFLGLAMSGPDGAYRFPLPAGPSRELTALYRSGAREASARASIQTVVHPTLRATSPILHNGEVAHLEGELPGPHNDGVVVVVQVRQGGGWLAFRRYTTRGGGHFEAEYRFRRTTRPTEYEMRAQVREAVGYPYLQGESDPLTLRVVPGKARPHRRRCAARKPSRAHGGRARCARRPGGRGHPSPGKRPAASGSSR